VLIGVGGAIAGIGAALLGVGAADGSAKDFPTVGDFGVGQDVAARATRNLRGQDLPLR
jgi:hypothetical protein